MTVKNKNLQKGEIPLRNKRLRPVQMMTFTTAAILGIDVLIFQKNMVSIAGQDAWISLLLGGFLAIIIASITYYLATLHPNKDLPQITLHLCGKLIGRLLLFPIIVYALLYAGFSLIIFAHALKLFILDRTPILAIVFLMSLVIAYAVYHGIFTIGALLDILFPLGKITIIALIMLSLSISNSSHLKPVLFENTSRVIRGIIPGFQEFTGISVIAYILCYTQQNKGRFKWYITGVIISIVLYTALLIVCIMVFGPSGILSLSYPTLTLSKSIEFPATFLERLEAFIAVLWISIVFESLILFLFASVRNFTVFLNLKPKHDKYVVYAHTVFFLFLTYFLKPGYKIIEYFELLKYIQVFMGMGILPILLFLTLIKRKKERSK